MKQGIAKCPTCGQSVNKRKVSLSKILIPPLVRIYRWCGENKRHEFTRKDIKHLLLDDNEITTFGYWVYYGGIFYKRGHGKWGINMKRARAFLRGESQINTVVHIDPLRGEHELSVPKHIHQLRGLKSFLDEAGNYVPEYEGDMPEMEDGVFVDARL